MKKISLPSSPALIVGIESDRTPNVSPMKKIEKNLTQNHSLIVGVESKRTPNPVVLNLSLRRIPLNSAQIEFRATRIQALQSRQYFGRLNFAALEGERSGQTQS